MTERAYMKHCDEMRRHPQEGTRMKATGAYTANQRIEIPDIEIDTDDPAYVYVPLRGHGYVLAVFNQADKCIGFIQSKTLGFASVKAWIVATNWIDSGY